MYIHRRACRLQPQLGVRIRCRAALDQSLALRGLAVHAHTRGLRDRSVACCMGRGEGNGGGKPWNDDRKQAYIAFTHQRVAGDNLSDGCRPAMVC